MPPPRLVLAALLLGATLLAPAVAQAQSPSQSPSKTEGDLTIDDLPLDGPPAPKVKAKHKPKVKAEPSKPAAGKTRLVPKSGKGAPNDSPASEGSSVFVATPPTDDLSLPLPPLPEPPPPPTRAESPARVVTPSPQQEAPIRAPAAPAAPARAAVTPEPEALPPPPLLIGMPAPQPAQARSQPGARAPTAAPAEQEKRPAPPAALSEGTAPAAGPRWGKLAGYGTAGLGAVLLGVATIEGARSSSMLSDAEASFKANGGAYAQRDLPTLQSANAAAHTANLLFLLGGVAVAAGAALLFAF